MTEPQQGIFALISASVLPTTRLAARRLGVVTLLASSLIACGGDPEDPKTSDDDDSQTTVTTIVVSSAATGAGPAGAGARHDARDKRRRW